MEISGSVKIPERIKQNIHPGAFENQTVVVIPKDGYCFAGCFSFQCVFGQVAALAHQFSSAPFSRENFKRFAVHKSTLPVLFQPLDFELNSATEEELLHRVGDITDVPIKDIIKKNGNSFAVIVVEHGTDPACSFISSRLSEPHRPAERYQYVTIGTDCYIVFAEAGGSAVSSIKLDTPPIERTLSYMRNQYSIIAILGMKDIGKSTMMRIFINSALNLNRAIYLLDTDVGQTEFTPPGCISLVKVTSPILCPPYLQQKHYFEETLCIGAISPGSCMKTYLSYIQRLMLRYNQIADPSKVLIVNTHGWVDGPGFSLMVNILKAINPTFILNMISDSSGFRIRQMCSAPYFDYDVSQRLNSRKETVEQLKAKTWREYALLGYFAECLGNEAFGKALAKRSLKDVSAYQLSFSSLVFYFHPKLPKIRDANVFGALNCAVVGLCSCVEPMNKSRRMFDQDGFPLILDNRQEYTFQCYGFGLIRGVSQRQRCIYLLTPVPQEICHRIKVFTVMDGITAPETLFDNDSPYYLPRKQERELQDQIAQRNRDYTILYSRYETTEKSNAIRTQADEIRIAESRAAAAQHNQLASAEGNSEVPRKRLRED